MSMGEKRRLTSSESAVEHLGKNLCNFIDIKNSGRKPYDFVKKDKLSADVCPLVLFVQILLSNLMCVQLFLPF